MNLEAATAQTFTSDFFNEASASWRQNKVRKNHGSFVYKCRKTACAKEAKDRYKGYCYNCHRLQARKKNLII